MNHGDTESTEGPLKVVAVYAVPEEEMPELDLPSLFRERLLWASNWPQSRTLYRPPQRPTIEVLVDVAPAIVLVAAMATIRRRLSDLRPPAGVFYRDPILPADLMPHGEPDPRECELSP